MDSITLPAEVQSIARARSFVRDVVAGSTDDPGALVLMTSELVTNVVAHTGSEVTVRVELGPPVRVEVCDGTAATEAFRDMIAARGPDVPTSAQGGRGLLIVHDLASRMGLDEDGAGGKIVWFEL
jgi:anti-sigma regulatory factor (Ser/Thr protein kinase)